MRHEPALAALAKWLPAHGPDDWHKVVVNWNWDTGAAPLLWIVQQPECDKATAQHIILNGPAGYLIRYPDRAAMVAARQEMDMADLTFTAIRNWNEGFYTRSEIASDNEFLDHRQMSHLDFSRELYEAEEAKIDPAALPWRLDRSVFEPLPGRVIEEEFVLEGWPPEIIEALDDRYNWPGAPAVPRSRTDP